MFVSETDAIIRLLVAVGLGAVVGLERELASKSAGLRTNVLVCLGSALFMLTSLLLGDQVARAGFTQYDPSRIASTVVQAVGVLAAAIVFASGGRAKGVTTAASLWVTAGIGLAAGAGYFMLAGTAAVLTVIVLHVLQRIEVPSRFRAGESEAERSARSPGDDKP